MYYTRSRQYSEPMISGFHGCTAARHAESVWKRDEREPGTRQVYQVLEFGIELARLAYIGCLLISEMDRYKYHVPTLIPTRAFEPQCSIWSPRPLVCRSSKFLDWVCQCKSAIFTFYYTLVSSTFPKVRLPEFTLSSVACFATSFILIV
jgi:hypothetical protein